MTNALQTWPERIYLHADTAAMQSAPATDNDVEYVRADLAAAPVAGSEREAFERSGLDLCSTNEGNWGVWQRAWRAALSQPAPAQTGVAELERMEKWAKWIAQNTPPYYADHACARCRPNSEILLDGFICTPHDAEDYLAAIASSQQNGGSNGNG